MYLFDNPVLQRELLVNLRMRRAFVLLLLYQVLLGAVVYFAWPQQSRLDLTTNPIETQRLVGLFFVGQYILASLMAPSFAAAAITGEKERKTYEMLLASPLRPAAIVLGKLLASLAHLAILIFTSLPIVLLALPLGGVSLYRVLAAYLGLILSVAAFGIISIACSSYFRRTAAALVVSYLLILPMALGGVLLWNVDAWLPIRLGREGMVQLLLTVTVVPTVCAAISIPAFWVTARRLLHPADVGSEGNEVVDIEQESQQAVGLVIRRDRFPDRLFAPARRTDFLPDGANPIYDKEIHSEIFAQGTLMLRLVIMVSMCLAIPLMAVCLYIRPQWAAWYIGYVVMFNMLVGPVFSAGSITSERERQTLDLLLTTTITPWQILWGKLVAGLRVSSVLTLFLLWPLLLACVMVVYYWPNLPGVAAHVAIVVTTCLTTAMLALFASVLFRKTSHSLMTAYLVIIVMFCGPVATGFFADTFFPKAAATRWVKAAGATSPFAAAMAVPMRSPQRGMMSTVDRPTARRGDWTLVGSHLALAVAVNAALLVAMIWLFRTRWRVAR